MRIPLSWLRDFVDVPWSAQGARRAPDDVGLRARGARDRRAAVLGRGRRGDRRSRRSIRRPRSCRCARCAPASGELLQIVCGAANARAGLKTALATVGAKLPGDKAITAREAARRRIRRHVVLRRRSSGSPTTSEGIVELPADAPVGTDLRAYLQLDDEILELNVTPNRGDAMSVLGIAREVAALDARGACADAAARAVSRTPRRTPFR